MAQARRKQWGVTRDVIPATASIPGVAFFRPTPARIPCQVAIFVTVVGLVYLRERLRKARAKRAYRVSLPGGGNLSIPGEEQLKKAIGISTDMLQKVDKATSCDGGQAFATTTSSWHALKAVEWAPEARVAAARLSARWGLIAGALAVADVVGIC